METYLLFDLFLTRQWPHLMITLSLALAYSRSRRCPLASFSIYKGSWSMSRITNFRKSLRKWPSLLFMCIMYFLYVSIYRDMFVPCAFFVMKRYEEKEKGLKRHIYIYFSLFLFISFHFRLETNVHWICHGQYYTAIACCLMFSFCQN